MNIIDKEILKLVERFLNHELTKIKVDKFIQDNILKLNYPQSKVLMGMYVVHQQGIGMIKEPPDTLD